MARFLENTSELRNSKWPRGQMGLVPLAQIAGWLPGQEEPLGVGPVCVSLPVHS